MMSEKVILTGTKPVQFEVSKEELIGKIDKMIRAKYEIDPDLYLDGDGNIGTKATYQMREIAPEEGEALIAIKVLRGLLDE